MVNISNSTIIGEHLENDTIDYLSFAILTLIFTLSIIFNTITIVTILAARMFTPINLLIMNLAFADLVYTLGIPMFVAHTFSKSWPFGQIGCQLFISTEFLGITVGILTICALSVERYLEVVDKKKRASQFSTKFKNALVIACCALKWIVAFAATLPFINGVRLIKSPDDLYGCGSDWSDQAFHIYFGIKFVLIFLIPLILITITSVKLVLTLREWKTQNKHIIQVTSLMYDSTTSNANISIRVKKFSYGKCQKATVLVLAVVIAFFLQWQPFWTFQLITLYTDLAIPNFHLVNMVVCLLSYSNAVVNPIIYMFSTFKLKKYWQRMLSLDKNNTQQSATTII